MTELDPEMKVPKGLTFDRDLSWEEVRNIWKGDEDTDIFRREYTEEGHSSWESWRDLIIQPLHLDQLDWAQYTVAEPLKTVPQFRGGPFKPWQDRYYGGKKNPTFAEIVGFEHSDIMTRDKFADILSSEEPIRLIGLLLGNEVYIIDGMHRSVAIALAARQEQAFDRQVTLMLAPSDLPKLETIE